MNTNTARGSAGIDAIANAFGIPVTEVRTEGAVELTGADAFGRLVALVSRMKGAEGRSLRRIRALLDHVADLVESGKLTLDRIELSKSDFAGHGAGVNVSLGGTSGPAGMYHWGANVLASAWERSDRRGTVRTVASGFYFLSGGGRSTMRRGFRDVSAMLRIITL